MISAIGWRLILCECNHIHLELLGSDDQPFAELVLECAEEVSMFVADVDAMMIERRKGEN
jgi:hypothetical protein